MLEDDQPLSSLGACDPSPHLKRHHQRKNRWDSQETVFAADGSNLFGLIGPWLQTTWTEAGVGIQGAEEYVEESRWFEPPSGEWKMVQQETSSLT